MWGRYRYRTAPQGLISAGDGYTHRKAEIMADFKNVKKCVDDSLLYDDNMEDNFPTMLLEKDSVRSRLFHSNFPTVV